MCESEYFDLIISVEKKEIKKVKDLAINLISIVEGLNVSLNR